MHCHIIWHASQGFALQYVERESEIGATISHPTELEETCEKWEAYEATARYEQDDSGI
jgi:hypothetical protein